jgi:hypothetical protein
MNICVNPGDAALWSTDIQHGNAARFQLCGAQIQMTWGRGVSRWRRKLYLPRESERL